MNIFESINNNSTKAVDLGEAYLKSSHDYYKLKIFEQMTISLSLIMKMLKGGQRLMKLLDCGKSSWSIFEKNFFTRA